MTAAMGPRAWQGWQAYVQATVNGIDAGSMTTKFSWSSLPAAVAEVGTSRARVAHYLAMLREAQLLAVVASGRSARYSPKTDNSNERTSLHAQKGYQHHGKNRCGPVDEH